MQRDKGLWIHLDVCRCWLIKNAKQLPERTVLETTARLQLNAGEADNVGGGQGEKQRERMEKLASQVPS